MEVYKSLNFHVCSLSTVYREYAALKGLPYYDLFDSIMKPRPAKLPEISSSRIRQAMETYRVNEPQAGAILGSLDSEGFALIQGYVSVHLG
jgi:senataxin